MDKNNHYKKKTVRNNGNKIGEMIYYNKNLKKILLFSSYFIISVSSYFLGRTSKDKTVYPVIPNILAETYFDEPTYSGIPYVVSFGDTLLDIVYSYESDTNKVQANLKLIEKYNGIDANGIYPGQTIYLVGVPASKLEEFGYTDNYNYFAPEVEVDLRIDFLNKVVDYIDTTDANNHSFLASVEEIKNDYADYKNDYVPGDDYKLDYIIDDLRDLSESSKEYGFSFENNLSALPLSEAVNYNAHKSY